MRNLHTIPAAKLCGTLEKELDAQQRSVRLHSCFENAANLSARSGMITLLAPGRCLQPGSLVLARAMEFRDTLCGPLSVSRSGIWSGERLLVDLQNAHVLDLTMPVSPPPGPESAQTLLDFLADHTGQGLVSMAFDRPENPFAEFLTPRLAAFRTAARGGDTHAAVAAVGRLAGCGPGLTPSSDDLICGYLAALPDQLRGNGFGQAIAQAAAEKTNDISANLLLWGGRNCFSEDILALKRSLCGMPGSLSAREALRRVASFGSSSGCDFLTGYYFGLIDFTTTGGISIEKT